MEHEPDCNDCEHRDDNRCLLNADIRPTVSGCVGIFNYRHTVGYVEHTPPGCPLVIQYLYTISAKHKE